jgi:lipoyl(octanoyl) transferase
MTVAADRPPPELWVCHLGALPYRDALALQLDIRARRLAGELPDTLLLLEHPPVYTRGRRSTSGELGAHSPDGWVGEDFYRAREIDVVDTDRGGRVTYHGPGQLVGYPIMGIQDISAHLRTMEAAIIAALAEYGVQARSRCGEGPDYTGVWVQDRKIASIGVHVSRGVSTHGFAVNVDVDLAPFSWIVACGLPDVTMTSIAAELRRSNPEHADYDSAALIASEAPDMARFRNEMARHFCEAHRRHPRAVGRRELMRGRTPRAHARGISPACADAGRSLIGQQSPTPDAATLVAGPGGPV